MVCFFFYRSKSTQNFFHSFVREDYVKVFVLGFVDRYPLVFYYGVKVSPRFEFASGVKSYVVFDKVVFACVNHYYSLVRV